MTDILMKIENVAVNFSPFRRFFDKSFHQVLKDVSFDIYRGESLGVIGRNGAGKSTLLKLLAGVLEPDSGKVVAENISVSLLALQVGFDGELSGFENIILSGLLLGFSKLEIEQHLDEIIEFSELGKATYKPVKSYSTGMRARLGFSIAYQLKPDVLLIDEILGVGDAEFKQKSIPAMKERINSEQTVVLVSHHGPTIQNLCRRAVWIEDGVTKMTGLSKDVVAAYEDYITHNSRT